MLQAGRLGDSQAGLGSKGVVLVAVSKMVRVSNFNCSICTTFWPGGN